MVRRVSVGRRAGHRHGGSVRVLPAVVLPGRRRAGRLRPGRPGAGQARAPRRPQAHRADPGLGRAAAGGRSGTETRRPGRADRRGVRGARAPPLHRASAGPPAGALQKPLTCPPPNAGKKENPTRRESAVSASTRARGSSSWPARSSPASWRRPAPGRAGSWSRWALRPAPAPAAPAPRYRSCCWRAQCDRDRHRHEDHSPAELRGLPRPRQRGLQRGRQPALVGELAQQNAAAMAAQASTVIRDLQAVVPAVMRRVAPGGFPPGAPSEPCVPVDPAHGSSKPRGRFRIGAVVPGSCAGGRRARAGRRRGRGVSVHRPAGWACRGRRGSWLLSPCG